MEAKDTVLIVKRIAGIAKKHPVWDGGLFPFLEAQAEISFPLGIEEGRKLGIKEVVDWIENNSGQIYSNDTRHYHNIGISLTDWQAQLKEWGIQEGQ